MRLFYPPYLQEYITLHGLDTLYKLIRYLFISINKHIEEYIIKKSKEEIEDNEYKNYSFLKELQKLPDGPEYYHNSSPQFAAKHTYYIKY